VNRNVDVPDRFAIYAASKPGTRIRFLREGIRSSALLLRAIDALTDNLWARRR